MWRRILLLVSCLVSTSRVCFGCQMPMKDKHISVCAFCSDSHAGIKWMVNGSSISDYPYGAFSLELRFRCTNSQGTITQDSCFDGRSFPALYQLTNPNIWRWHVLGQTLTEGTDCVFTANVKDGYSRELTEVSSSCSIESEEKSLTNLTMPAKCTEASDHQSTCSCYCSDGFEVDVDHIPNGILTCTNINECADGTHLCNDYDDCNDTEGSYSCHSDTDKSQFPLDSEKESDVPPIYVTIVPTATLNSSPTPLAPLPTPEAITTNLGHISTRELVSPTPREITTITPATPTTGDAESPAFCTTTTSTTTICTITTSTSVCCY